jgi:dihydrodipicolinate synthase/N-acetylneuraminate lyase
MELPARADAKEWAREVFRGVCNVIIPSFTADLNALNEAAIRHDVRRNIELGFWGALLVSEAGTTHDEMRQFMEIAKDEAAGRHRFLLQGVFDTADDIIAMCRDAAVIGVDGVLLGHPNSFYPVTAAELEEYTAHVCAAMDLPVVLFVVAHSNLARLDVRGFPPDVLERLAAIDTVVAVKYELGRRHTMRTYECFRRMESAPVLMSDPMEFNAPMWVDIFDMQWMGTSNYEYYGGRTPQMFRALRRGDRREAMRLYWEIQPAREARASEMAALSAMNFVHRYLWKYQAWLTGYNGGPLRQPAPKLSDGQIKRVTSGLLAAGVIDEAPHPADFFVGRNPQ